MVTEERFTRYVDFIYDLFDINNANLPNRVEDCAEYVTSCHSIDVMRDLFPNWHNIPIKKLKRIWLHADSNPYEYIAYGIPTLTFDYAYRKSFVPWGELAQVFGIQDSDCMRIIGLKKIEAKYKYIEYMQHREVCI